ncbi:MAG: 3-isopropylmalate dehydratase small subunit [Thermaurantiacus sp.]
MEPFKTLSARAIPFGADNVDTDLIIPSKYLKSVTRDGLGRGAFEALREYPENPFDTGIAGGAQILIAGDNFGCGSSREHAPWAILDLGLKVVIAESFADIFAGNSFKNGLLAVSLPRDAIHRLMELAAEGQMITVDLENQVVTTPYQDRWPFEIDPFRRKCLLEGLDEIALTEAQDSAIGAHEARIAAQRPWVPGAARRA